MNRTLVLLLLAVASARGESFESLPAGPFTSQQSTFGTWTAAEGHASIQSGRGKTGSQSLRLMGDGGRELLLTLSKAAQEGVLLSLHVERWTARKPFEFRIDAKGDSDWQEIRNAGADAKVGAFHTEIRLPLAKGTRALRFRCNSGADGGVLMDDVLLHSPGPARAVLIETAQPVCPAFIREIHNPVLGFRIVVEGSEGTVSMDGIELGFGGTTRMEDLESFRIVTGSADPSGPPGPEIASGRGISEKITLSTKHQLVPGEHWFWVSPVLKPKASIDGRIDASLFRVKISGKVMEPVLASPAGSQRIGYAVRLPGDDGSKSYRIPGIVRSKAGSLIAVYDIRHKHAGDLPADIDVGVSRSRDGGQSWEPMRVAMDTGNDPKSGYDGVGDPAVLADPKSGRIWITALWSHGSRGWNGSRAGMTPDETGQLMICHSDDDGVTWSKPESLTSTLKDPSWWLFYNGPGAGIVLRDGTLAFAAQYRAADGKPWSTMIASKNGGENWNVGSGVKSDTTEAQLAELDDGSVMINCRDNRGGFRTIAVTKDLGKTWQLHPTDRNTLRESVCMASLIGWKHPQQGSLLWFSNPDTARGRHSMTIKPSTDQGMTWPDKHHRLYDSRHGFGYSCLVPVDDTRIGVLYEGKNTLYFLRFPLTEWFE